MARRSRPTIGQPNRWNRWEDFCLRCLHLALARLRSAAGLPQGENALNARLLEEIRIAARELCPQGFSYPPIRAECPVQPYGASDESHRRLKPTPDITWGYEDDREPDPLKATRDFVIECKRIGPRTASGWVFTTHYVDDGVSRFADPEKRYGEGVPSGAIVGYWQGGVVQKLYTEVAVAASSRELSTISRVSRKWRPRGVTQLTQTIERTFEVSPFRLIHLWLDLR